MSDQRTEIEPIKRQSTRTLQEKGRKAVAKNYRTLQALKITYVKPTEVYPNSYNPNRQSEREFELLCSSMLEDGFTQPIIVQEATKEIVDGEHRWRAAQRIGLTEIPVVFVDMPTAQQRISTLRHNRARGSEDIELTIQVMKDLQELGALDHAISSLKIDDREMNALLADLPAPDAQAAEEFSSSWVPAPPKVASARVNYKGNLESATDSVIEKFRTMIEAGETAPSEDAYTEFARNQSNLWVNLTVQFEREVGLKVIEYLGAKPAQNLLDLCKFHLENV